MELTKRESSDAKLALVVLGVVAVLFFWIGRASAAEALCKSYEECMEGPYITELNYLKAIAYKLDEISKKLDKDNTWKVVG